jgi:hypothetical protein
LGRGRIGRRGSEVVGEEETDKAEWADRADRAEGAEGVYRSTRQTNEKFHTTGLLKIYQTIGEGQNWQKGQLSSKQGRDRQGRGGIGGV